MSRGHARRQQPRGAHCSCHKDPVWVQGRGCMESPPGTVWPLQLGCSASRDSKIVESPSLFGVFSIRRTQNTPETIAEMKRSRDLDIKNVSVCMKRIARSCATTRLRPFILMIFRKCESQIRYSDHFQAKSVNFRKF